MEYPRMGVSRLRMSWISLALNYDCCFSVCATAAAPRQQCGGTEHSRLPQTKRLEATARPLRAGRAPRVASVVLVRWRGVSSNRVSAPPRGIQTAVSPERIASISFLHLAARWFPFADERSTCGGRSRDWALGAGTKDGPWRLERGVLSW